MILLLFKSHPNTGVTPGEDNGRRHDELRRHKASRNSYEAKHVNLGCDC
jgi:hypothetical protein